MHLLEKDQELHLRDYVNVLRRRKNVAALFFIVTVVLVTAGSFIMRPVYRATTTILIDMESPNVLTSTGVVALESQQYYSYKEYYQSQIEIITSLSILKKVFDEFNLGVTREYENAKEPLEDFRKTIKIEPVRDTRLLRLSVENMDPVLAANIANRITDIYVMRNLYYISRAELMNLLKNEYLKLEAKLSEYNKIYKHKHPKMIRLKQEMSEMAGRIDKAKESKFDVDFFVEEDADGDKYALEGFKANNISIQDPAEVPVVPVRPKKKLNILIAVIVGLMGGVGLAFFFEYLDDTVKRAEDIGRLVKWPFLGSVADINRTISKISDIEKDILVHTNPKDPVAEAYRAIRTSIVFSSTKEHLLKSLVITSPGPQEGKTTTLCNLGISMAQRKKRVLLVDADMRKPRLHLIFGKENSKGLSTYLSLQNDFDEIAEETQIDNLFVVTGGPNPPDPSELLSSDRMKEFIDAANKKFDIILFDTPPIVIVTDATILAHMTDGIVMVIEADTTSRRVLPRIEQILKDAGARVIGIVINKISMASSGPYYYYYSRYYGTK